jgi:hypothetical protein
MKKLSASIVYWKLAITKVAGKSLIALFSSIVATLNGVSWSDFTGTQQFLAVAAGLAAMWSVIDAFLDNTMSELKKKQESGDTAIFIPDPTDK